MSMGPPGGSTSSVTILLAINPAMALLPTPPGAHRISVQAEWPRGLEGAVVLGPTGYLSSHVHFHCGTGRA